MNDADKTREELLAELFESRERLALLESSNSPETQRLHELEDDLRLVRSLATAAQDSLELRDVAKILATEVQRAFGSRGVNLYVVSSDTTELQLQNVGFAPGILNSTERLLGMRVPLARILRTEESLYWKTLETGQTQVYRGRDETDLLLREFASSVAETRVPRENATQSVVDGVLKLLALECIVLVPLIAQERPLGLLAVSARDQFTDEDVERLTVIGQLVAGILGRARAELDWALERDRADAFVTAASGFLLVIDADGKVSAISRAGCEILGLPENRIIGCDWAESFVPERFRESARKRISDLLGGGADEIFDGHALTAQGDERVVRWRLSAMRNANGRVTGLFASGTDLTRVKESEERAFRNERRYRALLENSTDLTVVLDANGIFTYVSPSVSQMLGFTPSEMMGTQAGTYVHADDVREFADALADAASRPSVSRSNAMRVRAKDGSWKVLEGRTSQQIDNPYIEGLILNLRDVTDRERIEGSIENTAARFRALIESSHELMLVLSRDLTVRYASPSCSRDLGYTMGALQGVNFEELVYGADLDRELFRASGVDGIAPYSVQMRLRTEDRQWVPYHVTITEMLESSAINGFVINATQCVGEVEAPKSA